jgi:hypothetical protein
VERGRSLQNVEERVAVVSQLETQKNNRCGRKHKEDIPKK